MAKDPNLDKYLRIVERLRAGKPVSKEEYKHFLGFTQEIDEVKLAKIRAKLSTKEGLANMTDDDVATYIDETSKLLSSDRYKEQTLELAKDAEEGRVSNNVATGLNLLLSGVDIATSIKQIRGSDKLLKETIKPGKPTAPGRDPYLAQALNQAQQGSFDQSRALAPAQGQILDQYLSDMNNARVVSSGQSGAYGSLGQVAANRRNKAAQELVPLADGIRAREKGRLDNLIGMRMNETQNNYANQSQFYAQDLDQYNRDMQAAGSLGATGRQNLRQSLGTLGQQVSGVAGRAVANKKYDNIYNQMSNYGEGNADIAVKANQMLDDRFSNLTSDDDIDSYNRAYY